MWLYCVNGHFWLNTVSHSPQFLALSTVSDFSRESKALTESTRQLKYSPSQERLQGCGIGRRLDRGETCPLYRQYVSSLLGLSLPNVRESCQNVSQTTVNVALSPAVVRWMNNSWEDGVYIALKRHKTDTSNERSIRIQKTFCASNCWQGKCCQRDRITAYQIALYTARKDGNPCSFRHHSNS